MMTFYHDRGIDMLKLGCTLPISANICLHSPTNAKFYPFTKHDRDLLNKIREDMVGGPSIVFTRKAIAEKPKFVILKISVRLLLEPMPANYILSPCVRKCRLGYTPDGKLMLKRKIDSQTKKTKLSSKGLNKHFLNESSDGPLQKYQKVLNDVSDIGSINRGFRLRNHAVYTYEQSKTGLSYFT